MASRSTKSGSSSPYYNVHVELDNKALKAKNIGLTQAVAKLQKENADLLKQTNLLQRESFEINSRYNNLKNVISIIDSTTKTCLPKLTEVVDTFTGIIQLCSVASNISNLNKDTRTQTVKPQIVNGHVLHNPTITLSRLEGNEDSYTHQRSVNGRSSSNITERPSTSRSSSDANNEILSDIDDDQSNSDSDHEAGANASEEHNVSLRCRANRGVCNRRQTFADDDMSRLQADDSDSSDDEDIPAEEEDNEDEERLTTIREQEEEEEDMPSPRTPRSKQRRFLQGRLQEVRIYLNQLPDTYVDQIRGSGNISISVSPPGRRSSFKNRSSSLVGEANESQVDNGPSFLDENTSLLNRSLKMNQSEVERRSLGDGQSNLSVTFNCPLPSTSSSTLDSIHNFSDTSTLQYSGCTSANNNVPTPTTSMFVGNSPDESKSLTMRGFNLGASDLQHKTSTPAKSFNNSDNSFNQTHDAYESPNASHKNETSLLKNNVTKRRNLSRDKRKVAQVVIKRLSLEKKRRSGSPLKKISDIINTPPITSLSEMKSRLRNSNDDQNVVAGISPRKVKANSNTVKTKGKNKKARKYSPTKKVGDLKTENLVKPEMVSSPKKNSPGRPKRAARPKTMREPSLVQKLRRSK